MQLLDGCRYFPSQRDSGYLSNEWENLPSQRASEYLPNKQSNNYGFIPKDKLNKQCFSTPVLYSGTSLQSTHYWDHSTVEPLSNPPTTGTTLQWNLFNNCNLNKIDNLVLMQLTPKSLDWCPARNPSTPGNSPPQCCWNRASTHWY